ncbi:MAG TPA: CRISPR-associated protein [Thermoflexia bacterium]|jgi:CRISPR-associated RAMP protein (TIGR02581 family)|nr:CRISPR-associated protein [Thermoflexia bacterium]
MHKRRLNELHLHLLVVPDGPILVKSGVASGADPTLPEMKFVRTRHPRTGERTIYLPGSSLKGVIRSHAERIIRTLHGDNPEVCCDPLSKQGCGERKSVRKASNTAAQYRALCLACRIFGHTVQASHFYIADAYPPEPIDELPIRHQVAIDRLSGGVAAGPFDLEVALEGKFETELVLFNFERWQVGLLALVLRDLAEGRLLIGYGKSRGLGRVQVHFGRLEITYPGRFSPLPRITGVLYGVGALAPDLVEAYGYVSDDQGDLPVQGTLVPESPTWGRPTVRFGAEGDAPLASLPPKVLDEAHRTISEVLASTVPAWAEYRPSGQEA